MTRCYALGNQIIYDVLKREISLDEYVVSIGGREAVILKLLCENVNQVLSKEDIQDTPYVADEALELLKYFENNFIFKNF